MFPSFRDVLRTLSALPFIAFLFAMAHNEYFFVPAAMEAACLLIAAAGIAWRIWKKRPAHTPFWLLVFLSVYNFPMVFGGLIYFHYGLPLVAFTVMSAGYLLAWKWDRPRRLGLAAVFLAIFGFAALHFFRDLDFDAELHRCSNENRRLDPVVNFVDGDKHPYDFALVPAVTPGGETIEGKTLLAAAYGLSAGILWFDGDGRRIRKTKLPPEGEVQRLLPTPDGRSLLAPPWGRHGRNEEILVVDIPTGRLSGAIPVGGGGIKRRKVGPQPDVSDVCRNLFELFVDLQSNSLFALCEVSHSLVRLDARNGRMTGHLKLPGRDAYDLAFDPATRRIVTTDYWSPDLTVVNADAMTIEKTVRVGWSTFGILLAGRKLYVARPLASEIVELDADSLQILRRFVVGFGVRDLDIDETRGVLFAGNYFDGTVDAVDLKTGHRLRRAFAGQLLRGLLTDGANDRLYLATGCGVKAISLKKWLDEKRG